MATVLTLGTLVSHEVFAQKTVLDELKRNGEQVLRDAGRDARPPAQQTPLRAPAGAGTSNPPTLATTNASLSFKDRFLIDALNKGRPERKRICAVTSYADLADWVYSLRGLAAPGVSVSVSMPGEWQKVSGGEFVDKATGLKAGLFRHPRTNEYVMFLAGTEDFERARAQWAENLSELSGVEKLALCSVHPSTCMQLLHVRAAVQKGESLESILSVAAKTSASDILSEEVVSNYLYAAIGIAFGASPDTYADVNIALPTMDRAGREMFERARKLYDDWTTEIHRGRFGPASPNGIVLVGGHSLGGAVAQVVALSRNVAAVTFNSAPVPLDPAYRREIGYDRYRFNILNVRASDDPLTQVVFSIQRDSSIQSWSMTLLEGIFERRMGRAIDGQLRSEYEDEFRKDEFYAGDNWLTNAANTGHGIRALADDIKRACSSDEQQAVSSDVQGSSATVGGKLVSENPFARNQAWKGTYVCAQGETPLTLRILNASPSVVPTDLGNAYKVEAVFDFGYENQTTAGAFYLTGAYYPESNAATFNPGQWISRPAGYSAVGMDGRVTNHGQTYTGRIPFSGCTSFQLQLANAAQTGNPFATNQVWKGTYICKQGETALTLRILNASPSVVQTNLGNAYHVEAIFDFDYNNRAAAGSFFLTGAYYPDSNVATFRPGQWISRPAGYSTVGMDGRVTNQGQTYTGRIPFSGCTSFQIRLIN
ncbi:MAG: hypothetical protein JNL68_17845 [Burkholderiales bacterium]|nr:hypothetical protein [Burkholderiales bacterium]